jgi:hypothetical protein
MTSLINGGKYVIINRRSSSKSFTLLFLKPGLNRSLFSCRTLLLAQRDGTIGPGSKIWNNGSPLQWETMAGKRDRTFRLEWISKLQLHFLSSQNCSHRQRTHWDVQMLRTRRLPCCMIDDTLSVCTAQALLACHNLAVHIDMNLEDLRFSRRWLWRMPSSGI